jgi:O-antigen ligase
MKVIQGRIELHQVAAPHLLDAPLTGLGSVEKLWPASRPQNHVHDDWLELALEQGIPAALLLAALTIAALRKALQKKLIGPAAALASLAARAFVDFPLARPAELALFVTLIAVALREEPCTSSPPSPSSPPP